MFKILIIIGVTFLLSAGALIAYLYSNKKLLKELRDEGFFD